jgi:hypothetical protein
LSDQALLIAINDRRLGIGPALDGVPIACAQVAGLAPISDACGIRRMMLA